MILVAFIATGGSSSGTAPASVATTAPSPAPAVAHGDVEAMVAWWNKAVGFYGDSLTNLGSALSDGYPSEHFDEVLRNVAIGDDTAKDWAHENVPEGWSQVADDLAAGMDAHRAQANRIAQAVLAHPGEESTLARPLLKPVDELVRARDRARELIREAGGDASRIALPTDATS